MPTKNIDLVELMSEYGTEDACRELLEELRWPNGPRCPRCEEKGEENTISRLKKREKFECDGCRYQFSVRAGTIFQDSKLPLAKWFLATYLMCESKKGVSANQLKRMLKVSYKTAWFLCHRIRAAMGQTNESKLSGVIEIDETFVGGEQRHKYANKRDAARGRLDNKAVVLAAVQRDGEIRMRVAENRRKSEIESFVDQTVGSKAKAVYTDEYSAYDGTTGDVPHEAVRHSPRNGAREWVRGQVHTNTVEGVFSLLKRSIVGSYHQISVKHLPAYVDEMEWRYNNRNNEYLFRDTLLELIGAGQLEYKKLTA